MKSLENLGIISTTSSVARVQNAEIYSLSLSLSLV